MRARELLEAQGSFQRATAFLGVVERIFASAAHMGFTLLIAHHPLLTSATIPIHSGMNLIASRLAPRSPCLAELIIALAGSAVLAAGLLLIGRS